MAYTKAELAAEFWMLTKGMLQDSCIDTDEAKVLKHWLEEHLEGENFRHLIDRLDGYLKDGYIDRFESKQLLDSFGAVLAQLHHG